MFDDGFVRGHNSGSYNRREKCCGTKERQQRHLHTFLFSAARNRSADQLACSSSAVTITSIIITAVVLLHSRHNGWSQSACARAGCEHFLQSAPSNLIQGTQSNFTSLCLEQLRGQTGLPNPERRGASKLQSLTLEQSIRLKNISIMFSLLENGYLSSVCYFINSLVRVLATKGIQFQSV